MHDEQRQIVQRIALISTIALAAIIASFVWFIVARVGLVQVDVTVVPSDAKVEYAYGTIKNGKNHLRVGTHTVNVSRDNFETTSYDVTVRPDSDQLAITTTPANDEGRDYLRQNRDEDIRYEIVGAILRQESSDTLIADYPKLADLPKRKYGTGSVYTVSYSGVDSGNNLMLAITNSSTVGRVDALRWMRQNGFEPSEINVSYLDYDSPLEIRGDN